MRSLVSFDRPSAHSGTQHKCGLTAARQAAGRATTRRLIGGDLTRKSCHCVASFSSVGPQLDCQWLLDLCATWLALDMATNSNTATTSSHNTFNNSNNHRADHLTNNRLAKGTPSHGNYPEDHPNFLVYKKMEKIVEHMQNEQSGVPVRTVKSFMTKIPSVFMGSDLIQWMVRNLDVDDQTEALHLAHLMAGHGYFFPIDDHVLTVKNDGTFYRFQTPYFWPSNCWEPENTDYAVYLCKRTMQNKTRLELTDYEAENLARLQKMFSRKWEFIFMQAEAQSKVDKKRDKLERKVLDSQERAFWDVHRPVVSPGSVNTTEMDFKKASRSKKVTKGFSRLGSTGGGSRAKIADDPQTVETFTREVERLRQRLSRRHLKMSDITKPHVQFFEQYAEYDPFIVPPEVANPWICDNIELWEQESSKDPSSKRVKRWAFSLRELLKDPIGRDHFMRFLEKEVSGENLRFWESVQELKRMPNKQIPTRVKEIFAEFLAPGAHSPVNIDSAAAEITRKLMLKPNRYSFEIAAEHIYNLMGRDSYQRFLRSDVYKELLAGAKKKSSVRGLRSVISLGRKDPNNTLQQPPVTS
ncbi:hypothetical protein RvY_09789-2 [Ramazzottius varieornatus]|uniref:Regulator of G-protein signaling 7 n=1 Tax=Ramazzottius varieornatus TaxID=947166 RepID=A0A1D1VAL7_RAMVA|nr:hypothetical protein RvY_09789-2 [Ramazzottius varieornatus]